MPVLLPSAGRSKCQSRPLHDYVCVNFASYCLHNLPVHHIKFCNTVRSHLPPPICGCSPPIGVVGATAAIPEPGDELNSCLALATLCLRCLPLCGTFEVPWGRTWDTFFRLNPQPGDPSPTNFAHAECESQPDEATVLHRSDLVRGDPRIAACACALLVPQ